MSALVTGPKFEQFSTAYRATLAAAIAKDPTDYMARIPMDLTFAANKLASHMLSAIAANPKMVNYDGRAFRAACKALQIKHTRKAIFEFIGYAG